MNRSRNHSTILTFPPKVSESDALGEFRSARLSSLIWSFRNGPLRTIAPAYLPFSLYRLRYELGRVCRTRFVALDQVAGTLDLFEFPEALTANDLLPIETRNRIAHAIPADRAEFILREKALRLIFQQGFFRLRRRELEVRCIIRKFHIPYWLGFFGRDGNLRCRVLDAVRRRMEGQKAALLFENWLIG
jgi:hypothetical protein